MLFVGDGRLKVALCISGQMRTFKECIKLMNKHIIKPLKPDIFIHTYPMSGICTKGDNGLQEKITYDDLKQQYNYKTAVIEERIGDFYKLGKTQMPEKLQRLSSRNKGLIQMCYKIYQCNELKSNYEKEQDFKYDMVIRTRPDIRIYQPIPNKLFNKENRNTLWIPQPDKPNLSEWIITDELALGSSQNMDIYSSLFLNLNNYWKKPYGNNNYPQDKLTYRMFPNIMLGGNLFAHHILKNMIPYEYFYYPFRIVRFSPDIKEELSWNMVRLYRRFFN
jgi:hypothetical protein